MGSGLVDRIGIVGASGMAVAMMMGCESPLPVVRRISPETVEEGTSVVLVMDTEACAPRFDIDRGTVVDDPMATVYLGDGTLSLMARRTGAERFETILPADMPIGSHSLTLQLSDGRRAMFPGRLSVEAAPVVVEQVASPRRTVGLGEVSVPVSITVANRSGCAVEELVLAPRFVRAGVDRSGDFVVHGPASVRLDPGTRLTVDYFVDLTAAVATGEIDLDARIDGGRRIGSANCTGSPRLVSRGVTHRWLITAPARETLQIDELQASPGSVRAGGQVSLNVSVRNASAGVPVTVEELLLDSNPSGVTAKMERINQRRIDPGMSGNYSLLAVVDPMATVGTSFTLSVTAIARDDMGTLHRSGMGGATATVTVNRR